MKIGYFLSSEENAPRKLVELAQQAERAGFQDLWISDHLHPWNDEQNHSPFVWSVIGAIAQATRGMHLTTAVTCPTVRIHPGIIAQAAATSALLLEGRFSLGLGSGEALNEHVFGDRWPPADVRLEMLEESVEVIRTLWEGGSQSYEGKHYTVENLRLYDLPEELPAILISGFGPKSISLAGRIGDGYCLVTPDGDMVSQFRSQGGGDKPVQGGAKVCWHEDERSARKTAHRLWANEALPGELAQILPTPAHFEQASQLVTEDAAVESIPCGPEIEKHLELIKRYEDAGFDELYIQQIGQDVEAFFDVYAREILPRFSS